jgi:hypothetical protein
MSQFIAGIVLFLIPGLLPAHVQYKSDEKGSRFLFAVNALTDAFLILICTYGYMYLLFGDVVFASLPGQAAGTFYDHYMLFYIVYPVGAYSFSFLLSILLIRKRHIRLGRGCIRPALLFVTAVWVILLVGIGYDDYAQKHIVINEVCSHNLSLILDDEGDNSDYIEIYNPSFTAVSLEGWYLTDDEDVSRTQPLSGVYVEPRSYKVLFANGSVLGCKLNEQGETLTLADENGNIIDQVEVPALATDVCYARLQDGKNSWSIVKGGTPGASNKGLSPYVIPTLDAPVFSVQSGFYEDTFQLLLQADDDAKIYYTLDGLEPTEESALYTGAITISDAGENENYYAGITGTSIEGDYQPDYLLDKCTVVKAMCVNADGETSAVASQVYFVGFDGKDGYDNVKIMSVVGDPDDFFSQDRGIYVLGDDYQNWIEYRESLGYSFAANYTDTDKTGERPVTVTLFDEEKNLISQENIGVRIRGGASKGMRQKGFNFYEREEYGEDVLQLSSKMLRTSGTVDTNKTMLRDVFNQSLVSDRDLAVQAGEPCVLFLNGEYWGLYNLQDRFTEGYLAKHYDIQADNQILVKQDKRIAIGEESDLKLYTELVSYAREQDLSQTENYEAIAQRMDIQSFIDQYCFEIYIANSDWPLNNIACFRSRERDENSAFGDCKWRWGLYDTDESTGVYEEEMTSYESNSFLEEMHWFGSPTTTPLMSNLLENEDFKKQFVLTFMDMVNVNFEYAGVHEKLYALAEIYAEPMTATYHRFNGDDYTEDTFYENIERIDEFYKNRSEYIVPYMAEAMGLQGSLETVTLQIVCSGQENDLSGQCGTILCNTTEPDLSSGEWAGSYYTDYPVTLTAVPAEGYEFAGWQISKAAGDESTVGQTLTVEVPEGGICIRAVFERAAD